MVHIFLQEKSINKLFGQSSKTNQKNYFPHFRYTFPLKSIFEKFIHPPSIIFNTKESKSSMARTNIHLLLRKLVSRDIILNWQLNHMIYDNIVVNVNKAISLELLKHGNVMLSIIALKFHWYGILQ